MEEKKELFTRLAETEKGLAVLSTDYHGHKDNFRDVPHRLSDLEKAVIESNSSHKIMRESLSEVKATVNANHKSLLDSLETNKKWIIKIAFLIGVLVLGSPALTEKLITILGKIQ